MSDELDKLESILEKKIKDEPYGGILRIPKFSIFEKISSSLRWLYFQFENMVKSPRNIHRLHGTIFGLSLVLSLIVFINYPLIGIILIIFSIISQIIIFPESVILFISFAVDVMVGLLKRGSLASICTPKEIENKKRSVEYAMLSVSPLLITIFFPPFLYIIAIRVISSIFTAISTIAYYYLSSALDCWNSPLREISESDLFSTHFWVSIFFFVSSTIILYSLVPCGFSQIFSWSIVLLSYAFISTILAIPSFQTAIYITTYWRGSETRKMFEEIEKQIRWF